MTIEEILKLGEMGYTKADIEKMTAPETNPEPEPKPEREPKPEPKPESVPAPTTEPKPDPTPKPDDYYAKISEQMAGILSAIQKSNIIKDQQPQPMTAEDALASIINPEEVKK